MRAVLVHSKSVKNLEEVRALLRAIGWEVEPPQHKRHLEECIALRPDVVVVAGGDGTVAKVARRLAHTDVPIAIVPLGTANNIARTLGIGLDARVAIAGLARARERRVDVGIATLGGQPFPFVEGFGVGVFAHVVAEAEAGPRKRRSVRKALSLIADALEHFAPRQFELEIDGRDVSGAYLLVAIMNLRRVGPALEIAPHAQVDDGLLDVALVGPGAKDALITHLRRAAAEGDILLPEFEAIRAARVRVRASGASRRWAHIDDRPQELFGEATIEVEPRALRLLVPSP